MTISKPKVVPALVVVLAVALSLRLIWAWLVPVVPVSDSVGYDAFARTLVEHGVFGWTKEEPFAFWPPGATFLHAAVYWLFGFHPAGIVALNIVLSLWLMVTTARIAMRLHGERVAVISAWVLALWPTLVMFTTVMSSELPFLAFSIAALDAWTAPHRREGTRAVVAGLLLGAAALIRPPALALPVVYGFAVAVYDGATREHMMRQLRIGILATLTMAIVVAPWTWRNYQLYGEPVLISTNGGITMWMGNAPGTDGQYMPIPDELSHLSDHEQAKILGARARQYILDDPVGFIVRSTRKLVTLYANESIGSLWNAKSIEQEWGERAVVALKRLTQVTWLLILMGALWGFWSLWRRDGFRIAVFSPLTVSIGFYSAVYTIMVAQERYHLSFAAQVAIFLALGITAWRERLVMQRHMAPLSRRVG